jgi:Trk K+ transport system NAD-binding subunit|tara:strand:+ start:6285 stop:6404 length:120 start_codon:yes stop_codon:yes gene_type:complete
MRIVIYGIEKVGIKIAETLYGEDHDVTIMDNDGKKIEQI